MANSSRSAKLLWDAYGKFRKICEAKDLKTAEEYDQEHKVHYFCKDWLEALLDLLKNAEDDRYLVIQDIL